MIGNPWRCRNPQSHSATAVSLRQIDIVYFLKSAQQANRSPSEVFMLSAFARRLLLILLSVGVLSAGVNPAQEAAPGATASKPVQQAPAPNPQLPVFRATSHLVTVDVVATDHHGQVVSDLTSKDFQVFEQIVGKKGQHEQHISQFEFVTQSNSQATEKQAPRIPAGVYTNLITMRRLPVPPTVLLVDGLNTDIEGGMQARRQMVKMLASIPSDTPVAVFLLGHRLQLLQGFTKDPALLKAAAQKAFSLDNAAVATMDARDDPSSLSSLTEEMFGASGDEAPPGQAIAPGGGRGSAPSGPSGPPGGDLQMAAIERFEKETIAGTTDMRVQTTLDSLRAIARHLSGYTGRKNLIWISSSFPLTISPDATAQHNVAFEGNRNYSSEVASVTNALADAKVAVYPVNPLGVQTQAYFDVSVRKSNTYGVQPNTLKNTLNRENEARFASQESMQEVAQQTGGKICVNNNDLADCVKTAVTEGSSYYELAYYPDAGDWRGEFHRISVKTNRSGVQLSFREGYYARTGETVGKSDSKAQNDPHLQEAACEDLLTSTSILLVAKAYPGDQAGQAKFFLAVDSKMLTLTPAGDKQDARLDLAVCALDVAGKPLQYMQDHVQQEVGSPANGAASVSISHVVQFAPKPETTRVRIVVRDVPSGRLGSVDVPYSAPGNKTAESRH
jgi:VWFA-related protein